MGYVSPKTQKHLYRELFLDDVSLSPAEAGWTPGEDRLRQVADGTYEWRTALTQRRHVDAERLCCDYTEELVTTFTFTYAIVSRQFVLYLSGRAVFLRAVYNCIAVK
jgi:hypothetical protein